MFDTFKSSKKGEINQELIDTFFSLSQDTQIKDILEECLVDIEDSMLDTIYHKGDVKLSKTFDTYEHRLCNIIIDGDLYIEGTLSTYYHPRTLIFVTGNVFVDNVISGGYLIVNKDLIVKKALIGDYNHGQVLVFGEAKAKLFYPEEHYFTLKGGIDLEYVFGNSFRLNENENNDLFVFNAKKNLSILNLLHDDFKALVNLETMKSEEYTEDLMEYIKKKELISYIYNNKPVFK